MALIPTGIGQLFKREKIPRRIDRTHLCDELPTLLKQPTPPSRLVRSRRTRSEG